jgi:hypothetical protein
LSESTRLDVSQSDLAIRDGRVERIDGRHIARADSDKASKSGRANCNVLAMLHLCNHKLWRLLN